MTEVEAYGYALLAGTNIMSSFAIFITFTFGYLAAAFFVGRKLTSAQAVIVSMLYLFAAIGAFMGVMGSLEFYATALAHAPNLAPNQVINGAEFWHFYMSVLLSAGIIASLYFMWSLRHSKEKE